MGLDIVGFSALLETGKGHQAVKGTAIQEIPSDPDGNGAADGSFSRPARAVNGDNG